MNKLRFTDGLVGMLWGIAITFLFVLLMGRHFEGIYLIADLITENNNDSKCRMYNAIWEANSQPASGLYYNETICFKVKDRTHAEVMETCSHEYLHYKYDKTHWNIKVNVK